MISPPADDALDVLVLLGTDHHPFDRMVRWADAWSRAHPNRRIFVQYGSSSSPTAAAGTDFLSPESLAVMMNKARVVVTHGGPGTISAARSAGHRPLVVARDPAYGEHIDDHQLRFVRWAADRDLASACADVDILERLVDINGAGSRSSSGDSSETETASQAIRVLQGLLRRDGVGRRPVSGDGPVVLFVGGFGRSGSTLVERVLDSSPTVMSLGEVVHLWRRGVLEDELCECGTKFSSCPFWVEVGDRAFGGWSKVDIGTVLALHDSVDRQRRVLRTLRPVSIRQRETILQYTAYYSAVYRAAAATSGADIVVDSSKHASLALALSNDRQIDLRVMHLVRDSVAVAYSWSKEVNRPETAERGDSMVRYSVGRASMLWASNNLMIQLARLVRVPIHRMRYEDFVQAPTGVLRRMWEELDLPGGFDTTITPGVGIQLERGHSIGGNPMRFDSAPLVIRSDQAWRESMPVKQRRAVKLLTAPLRAWLGYRIR